MEFVMFKVVYQAASLYPTGVRLKGCIKLLLKHYKNNEEVFH
jgi:hypothetical protein